MAKADLTSCGAQQQEACRLSAEVPAGAGEYALTASMRRQVEHSAQSTGVESVRTFRSERTSEEPVPLMAVRYASGGWTRTTGSRRAA
ncbi:hypothetical protein E1267_13365 [Nonomuraea longispora]|uniref:Uncharacterized protein n=1 Tax=Nonomuraea longispora TaxID=1848320 RepID=A0A4R4NE75_9ACTN|nr:hypothetical protein [Nonomuraea longispora]TDC07458.1 hypothetical protein E1267_13365 [Nonomuraea longispora]